VASTPVYSSRTHNLGYGVEPEAIRILAGVTNYTRVRCNPERKGRLFLKAKSPASSFQFPLRATGAAKRS